MPEEELLPLCLAIGRVFAKYGEKKNRNTARLKFLVNKIGIDEFKRRVEEERAALEPDPRWTDYLQHLSDTDEQPLRKAEFLQIKNSRRSRVSEVVRLECIRAASGGLSQP